jgi:hypothetical protein
MVATASKTATNEELLLLARIVTIDDLTHLSAGSQLANSLAHH